MSKPITAALRMFQGGAFDDECGLRLAEVVKQVDETGKAGRITITLDVAKAGGALAVSCKVTDKTPERKPDADLYWATVEGNLSLDNPAQQKLDLRAVEGNRLDAALRDIDQAARDAALRDIDQATGEIRSIG